MFKFALENLKEKTDSAGIKKAKQYLEKLSKFKVENNCQKFAAALELLYRGITKKVTPAPTIVTRYVPGTTSRVYSVVPVSTSPSKMSDKKYSAVLTQLSIS